MPKRALKFYTLPKTGGQMKMTGNLEKDFRMLVKEGFFIPNDSGSMLWDFNPDHAGFAGPGVTHCRDIGTQCGGLPITDRPTWSATSQRYPP
jgi:hypothetical protein